jgi:hypothetical protein
MSSVARTGNMRGKRAGRVLRVIREEVGHCSLHRVILRLRGIGGGSDAGALRGPAPQAG